jgi:hypothetical protein
MMSICDKYFSDESLRVCRIEAVRLRMVRWDVRQKNVRQSLGLYSIIIGHLILFLDYVEIKDV